MIRMYQLGLYKGVFMAEVKNNKTESFPPCRMEDYITRANCFQPPLRSMLQVNAEARIAQKDYHAQDKYKPMNATDMQKHQQIHTDRHRYNREWVNRGGMTHDRTRDDKV